jgi:hypothetical protein
MLTVRSAGNVSFVTRRQLLLGAGAVLVRVAVASDQRGIDAIAQPELLSFSGRTIDVSSLFVATEIPSA